MRHPFPRTTFGLVGLVSVILGVAAFGLGATALYASHQALEHQLDRRIATETRALVAEFGSGGMTELANDIRRRPPQDASDLLYLVTDPAGRKVAGSLPGPAPAVGWQEFLPVPPPPGEKRAFAQAVTTALADGSRLVVAAPRRPIDQADAAIGRIVVVTTGGMLVIGVGAAWLLRALLRRRLNRINQTAEEIIAGHFERRIPRDDDGDEVDRLAGTLNTMLDRISELLANLRQVSTDIAHDLRTPLSRQQQVLQAALQSDPDLATYRAALERSAENGREMLELFSALLRISEIETFDLRASFVSVDLSELVERVTDAFRPDIEASGHRLTMRSAAPTYVRGDSRLLAQMLANLLENAVRHTPPATTISVWIEKRTTSVRLCVADDGPGIPANDRDAVLRRFTRLEQSRSTPGYGLGMSLASAVARAHYSEIVLSDNGPGLRIDIEFPVQP
jgi:signal transduction histidine kinase